MEINMAENPELAQQNNFPSCFLCKFKKSRIS